MTKTIPEPGALTTRIDRLFGEHQQQVFIRTDRMFAGLMIFQWITGIGMALWISPKTWQGQASETHLHVFAAIFLGAAIAAGPVALVFWRPGERLTRQVIAIAQMLVSALLIDLTGGRIETHFHIFGSLAFLAFYRDWRVLLTATVITAVDHLARGAFWTETIFGVMSTSPWRWIEHAAWVGFEDVFLFISIRQSVVSMRDLAERQARLESTNAMIEHTVFERTTELQATHLRLVVASRQAGMAEVATDVLHNVGNVLNSVNVSVSLLADNLRKSKVSSLGKIVTLFREHESDLGSFLSTDQRGRKVPELLYQLYAYLAKEQANAESELNALRSNVDHIKEVVAMQQTYAKVSGVSEAVKMVDLVEDALQMNAGSLDKHGIQLVREYAETGAVLVDKHRVLQILVNLIRNAKLACDEAGRTDKRMNLQISQDHVRVRVAVEDNGIGIPAENLTRIFNHGFTTRKDGHGFGLHSSANAAKEMGGSLRATSPGPGGGARFILELPLLPSRLTSP